MYNACTYIFVWNFDHVTQNQSEFYTLIIRLLVVILHQFSYCCRRELEAEVSALRTKVETLEAK